MRRILKRYPRVRVGLLVVLTLVALTGAAFVIYFIFRSPINLGAFEQIQLGMSLDDVTVVLGVPPGYYEVPPAEQFIVQKHEGTISFGSGDYFDAGIGPAISEIVSRTTKKPVARLLKWANDENAIFVLTEDERLIGKMYCISKAAFNRTSWIREIFGRNKTNEAK